MRVSSHVVQRVLGLPAPQTRALTVHRDLRVPMADGVELLADRWAPRDGGDRLPLALIRSPYGGRGFFGEVMAAPLAERGLPGADPEHPRHVRVGGRVTLPVRDEA